MRLATTSTSCWACISFWLLHVWCSAKQTWTKTWPDQSDRWGKALRTQLLPNSHSINWRITRAITKDNPFSRELTPGRPLLISTTNPTFNFSPQNALFRQHKIIIPSSSTSLTPSYITSSNHAQVKESPKRCVHSSALLSCLLFFFSTPRARNCARASHS